MIEFNNVTFAYGKNKPIVKDLNLSIDKGIHVMLGANGIGKTTLLHLACGLRLPTKGTIKIDGNADLRSSSALKSLFFMSDKQYDGGGSIMKITRHHHAFYPNFSQQMFEDNLKELEIEPNKSLLEMSNGQQKKARLAYALSLGTPLLLLDEPTNGLDAVSRQTVQKLLIKDINENQTVIISSHSAVDFEKLYDSLIFFLDRDTVIQSSTDEISSTLSFVTGETPCADALYYENNIYGYISISPNSGATESNVDADMLFRGLTKNNELKTFLKK